MTTQTEISPSRHLMWSDAVVENKGKHPLEEKLWNILISVQTEVGYTPDRARQQLVFSRIQWDTFVHDLEIGEGRTEGAGKMLRGKLFETLLNADPAFGERSKLELELLDLAHNPDKYHLSKELGYHRNPDMAFIVTTNGDSTLVEGIGEAKLGLLNVRSFKQLSDTGFERGAKALVDVVNSLENPEDYGLVEVGKAGKLAIAPNFTQLLVVPANRHVEYKSKLISYREFSDRNVRKEMLTLLNDPDRVIIRKAAFSTAEVGALASYLHMYKDMI